MADRILSEILELDIDRCSNTYGSAPCTAGIEQSGTATAGDVAELTLAAGASAIDDAYNGMIVVLDDGRENTVSDYDGTTKVATMVSTWPQNWFTYSRQLDNAAWTKSNCTITQNAIAGVDGTLTADRIVEAVDVAKIHSVTQTTSANFQQNRPFMVAARIKPDEHPRAYLYCADGSNYVNGSFLMTGAGSAGGSNSGNGSFDRSEIYALSDGWYLCAVFGTVDTAGGAGTMSVTVRMVNSSGQQVYDGDGSSGFYVDGVWVVQGDALTDYLDTVASAYETPSTNDYDIVNRAAACYNTFATCQDKPNYAAGTHTVKFTKRGSPIPAGQLVRPYIHDIDRAPTEIDIESGYAVRAATTLRLGDEPDSDVDEDPYVQNRATPALGTFWTRLLARSPNVINRTARMSRAFVNGGVWGTARVEQYVIEEIKGPNQSGVITVVLKDPTKKVDRVKIPAPTDGKLVAALPATSASGTAQGGSTTTIVLASNAVAVDDTYNGQEVYLTGNIGSGQRRIISDYVGATRTATVSVAWVVTPTATTTYEVAPLSLEIGSAYIGQYNDPASTGNREFVRIGAEIIEYTAVSGNTLTWPDNSYRANSDSLFKSTREDHDADDVVQQCRVWVSELFTDVVIDILNDSGIASGDIDTAGFAAQDTDWLGENYRITACLSDPADGDDLLTELLPMAQAVVWWDPTDQLLKFQVLLPGAAASYDWDDTSGLIDRSVNVERLNDLRRTRYAVSFGLKDYTEAGDEAKQFSNSEIAVDTDAESTNEYGDVRPEIVYTKWFTLDNVVAMRTWAARKVIWYRDAPKRLTVALDPKDAPVALGAQATITTSYLADATGAAKTTRVLVTRVDDQGSRLLLRLRTTPFEKNYGFIAPNGTADHPTDTAYAHICTAGELMGDGSDPYLII